MASKPKLQVRAASLDPSDKIKLACPYGCGFTTAKLKEKKEELEKHVKTCKLNPHLKEIEIEKIEAEEKKLADKLAKAQEKKAKVQAEKKDLGTGKQRILRENGIKKIEFFADKAMVLPLSLWSNPTEDENIGATLNAWTYMEQQGYTIMKIMPLYSGPPLLIFRLIEKTE